MRSRSAVAPSVTVVLTPDAVGEYLSQHCFAGLSHMHSIIDNWQDDYNHHRPHSSWLRAAVLLFAAQCRKLAGAAAQPQHQLDATPRVL